MDKIAFVVVRYGKEINGGAELHCKMLAERLTNRYRVEVLTTCVKNYVTGENDFPEGQEMINGVLVRRFKANPIEKEKHWRFNKQAKWGRRWRMFLYQTGLLRWIAALFPVWTYKREFELKALNSGVFYSSDLFAYIDKHRDDYKVFIPVCMDYAPTYYTAVTVPDKTLVIPTMHYDKVSFRSILTEIGTKVAYIGFNTRAEEKLGCGIFGPRIAPHGIISVGIEVAHAAAWEATKKKYNLPPEYLLYVGRVDTGKLYRLFEFFTAYKQAHPASKLKLVMVGGIFMKAFEHPDIIYTGFVEDEEKTVIIQHAKIMINPSKFESLSLIVLEALSMKKAMLVNGQCNVLREHCRNSHHAVLAYYRKKDFIKKLHKIDSVDDFRHEMEEKSADYVEKNYNWNLILKRLTTVIEDIARKNERK